METNTNTSMNEKLIRTDTKALVGAVITGIVMLIMMQVSGRIDAISWLNWHVPLRGTFA